MLGWLLLALLTAGAALGAIAVAVRASPSGRAELAIASLLGFFALIETPVMLLGYTQQLYAPRLAIVSAVLSGGAFLASSLGRGVGAHARDVRRAVATLALLPLDALREALRARSAVAVGLVAGLGAIVVTIWFSYLAPGEGWDALFYHEPIVGYAIQDHGFRVESLPANPMVQQINGYPRGAEAVPIWFCIFSDRTFIEIGNTIAAPGLVIAVFAIARRYGERVASMGWGVVTLLMPAMYSQMRHAYIDVEITFFVMAALHFATKPALRVVDVAWGMLGLALLVAGKGTGLLLAPPIAFVAFVRLLVHHGRTRRWASLALIAGSTLALSGIVALTLVKNIAVFHNPVWPVTYDNPALGLHLRGLIKYHDMNPTPPLREMLRIKYEAPHGDLGDVIHHDYGVAVPWVVWPVGVVALAVATLAALRDLALRRWGVATNFGLVALLGLAAFFSSNSLHIARFNVEWVCVLMFAIVWALRAPRWARFGEAVVASAIVLSIVPILWTKDWYWGLSEKKLAELRRASHAERAYMSSDPGNMPPSVGRVREQLGPGDLVVFTQDESWIATLWNFQFSNQVRYLPWESPTQFASALAALKPKWVVVGGSGEARAFLDARATEWSLVGVATAQDGTVAFQRR